MSGFALLWLTGLVACHPRAVPRSIEVPAGFAGEVVIEYDAPGSPAFPIVGGREIIRVDPTGFASGSNHQTFGTVDDVVTAVDASGKRTPLTLVICTGESVSLRPGEVCELGGGVTERPPGHKHAFSQLMVGPAEVDFDLRPERFFP